MSVIKSLSVGNGDMYYIRHNSDNFTIIDCYLSWENYKQIITELKAESKDKGICRFISTHPDEDHIGGIDWLDDAMPILNFYVVKNKATKPDESASFKRYCQLRDGEHAYYVSKGCNRRWMNQSDDERKGSGINILWPDVDNEHFKSALKEAEDGIAFNNMSLIAKYSVEDGVRAMWLGDLETEFMESITNYVKLEKTHIVFASHHGRSSGKIPNTWLEKLQPDIIVLGETPSRDLYYYTGYDILTQNSCGDIIFECDDDRVHVYVSSDDYEPPNCLINEYKSSFNNCNYIGSLAIT
jgi:beta-lactamase superfamily II metal-dependent hydrolase